MSEFADDELVGWAVKVGAVPAELAGNETLQNQLANAVPRWIVDDCRDAWRRQKEADAEPLALHRLSEVAREAASQKIEWLIEEWLIGPSYGMTGGAEKSCKSWITAIQVLSIATGRPLFGDSDFAVPKVRPVAVFTGELGRVAYRQRLLAIGQALGLSTAHLDAAPIIIIDAVENIRSGRFQATLRALVDEGVEFVLIDPLYAYHGSSVEASNVHAVGEVLLGVSQTLTVENGVSAQIVNHFRKNVGRTATLQDITQAGSREWSDTWQLVTHNKPPTIGPSRHLFDLRVDVGARRGWGASFRAQLSLPVIDKRFLEFNGALEWDVRREVSPDPQAEGQAGQLETPGQVRVAQILEAVRDENGQLTKTGLQRVVGGNKSAAFQAITALITTGALRADAKRKLWIGE